MWSQQHHTGLWPEYSSEILNYLCWVHNPNLGGSSSRDQVLTSWSGGGNSTRLVGLTHPCSWPPPSSASGKLWVWSCESWTCTQGGNGTDAQSGCRLWARPSSLLHGCYLCFSPWLHTPPRSAGGEVDSQRGEHVGRVWPSPAWTGVCLASSLNSSCHTCSCHWKLPVTHFPALLQEETEVSFPSRLMVNQLMWTHTFPKNLAGVHPHSLPEGPEHFTAGAQLRFCRDGWGGIVLKCQIWA